MIRAFRDPLTERLGARIRVNDQSRICFRWTPVGAVDVEFVDYH